MAGGGAFTRFTAAPLRRLPPGCASSRFSAAEERPARGNRLREPTANQVNAPPPAIGTKQRPARQPERPAADAVFPLGPAPRPSAESAAGLPSCRALRPGRGQLLAGRASLHPRHRGNSRADHLASSAGRSSPGDCRKEHRHGAGVRAYRLGGIAKESAKGLRLRYGGERGARKALRKSGEKGGGLWRLLPPPVGGPPPEDAVAARQIPSVTTPNAAAAPRACAPAPRPARRAAPLQGRRDTPPPVQRPRRPPPPLGPRRSYFARPGRRPGGCAASDGRRRAAEEARPRPAGRPGGPQAGLRLRPAPRPGKSRCGRPSRPHSPCTRGQLCVQSHRIASKPRFARTTP